MTPPAIERWIKAQAIGLSAYATGAFSTKKAATHLCTEAMKRLTVLLGEWEWERQENMIALPANVLYALAALKDAHIEPSLRNRIQTAAHNALEHLTPPQDSPLAMAEILAHHIMYGSGSPQRITRMAISLMRRLKPTDLHRLKLIDLEKGLLGQRFDDAIGRIRAPNGSTTDRLSAIEDIWDLLLLGRCSVTPQVGNILCQHVFCWPLLVSSGAAVSVPIAVDVDLTLPDGFRQWFTVAGNEAFDLTNNASTGESWIDYLKRAREAAYLLWLKTHGNCGKFCRNIRRHQVQFDFHWASEIARLALGATERRLPLEGDSATAYFAQIVLARLLGKRWYLSSAITGAIGRRVVVGRKEDEPESPEDELDRDFWFKKVGRVPEKFRYVRMTRSFERFVLPPRNQPDIDKVMATKRGDPMRTGGEVQVAHPAKLSGVADVVQIEGWRKTHFIRCPEVAHVIHGDGRRELPDTIRKEAQRVKAQLAASDRSVLPLNARPAAVALALAEINTLLHENAKREIASQENIRNTSAGTLAQRRERGHLVPGLSWCVIRAVKEEQDASFWRTLWRIIGAPLEDFERIRYSSTKEVAARRLAMALNRYAPCETARSHRAPDVIILVGLKKFAESTEANETPLARPLAVEALLKELDERKLLRPSRYRSMRYLHELAGVVRFVLVPECEDDPVPQPDVRQNKNLSKDDWKVMRTLATFRFGFSQQMASLLLSEYEIRGTEVRDQLKRFSELGALREVSGQYFLSHRIRRYLQENLMVGARPEDKQAEGRRQAAAGVALAPYTTVAPVPGLAYDLAFLPENVKEAEEHFRQADDLYVQVLRDIQRTKAKVHFRQPDDLHTAQKLQNDVRTRLQGVCRFSSVPHWGMVTRLNRAHLGKDAWELANDLMAGWQQYGGDVGLPPHPIHFKSAMVAATHWEQVTAEEVERLYKDGLAACRAYPSEESFCETQLAATYSMYLFRRHRQMTEKISEADKRVWSHKAQWTNVPGEWFEKNGDCCQDHKEAASHYLLGTQHAPQWMQNWVKAIGAGLLTDADLSNTLRALPTLDVNVAAFLRKSASKCPDKTVHEQQKRGAWCAERWTRGFTPLCCWLDSTTHKSPLA